MSDRIASDAPSTSHNANERHLPNAAAESPLATAYEEQDYPINACQALQKVLQQKVCSTRLAGARESFKELV